MTAESTIDRSPSDAAAARNDERLRELHQLRDQAEAESHADASGDPADRSFNIEALIRIDLLDAQIAELERIKHDPATGPGSTGNLIAVGTQFDLRFEEDGPVETYVLAPIETMAPTAEVISPSSPLGRALIGASAGQTVTYEVGHGRTVSVTVDAIT